MLFCMEMSSPDVDEKIDFIFSYNKSEEIKSQPPSA